MTAKCKDCGWEGAEDLLEVWKCPECGSRHIVTKGSRLSHRENLKPPAGARKGD